jgi:hypothetical protein
MGYWSERDIARSNGWDDDDDTFVGDLDAIAAMLGGEFDGKYVRCPSPGHPADDRSCHVRIDGPKQFFVYDCEGTQTAAYAMIRKRLELAPAPRRDYTDLIRSIRSESIPAPGTLVETYLRSRGITIPIPTSLAFHPSLWNSENQTRLPGMVAERTDVTGTVITVHRTFLKYNGTAKAPVTKPRLDLHSWRGTAIRLSPCSRRTHGWRRHRNRFKARCRCMVCRVGPQAVLAQYVN